MATKIKDTPVLTGKDAERFMEKARNPPKHSPPEIERMKSSYQKIKNLSYASLLGQFRQSNDYKRSEKAMKDAGMKHPYIDNILTSAFDKGYNAKS